MKPNVIFQNAAKFNSAMAELAARNKWPLVVAMGRATSRLWLQAVRHTPPMGGAPGSENWKSQKELGVNAVERDIGKIFREIRGRINLSVDEQKHGKIVKREGGRKFRCRPDRYMPAATLETLSKIHNKYRNRVGRVVTNEFEKTDGLTVPHYYAAKTTLKAYIQKKVAKVGHGKSGWVKAWKTLSKVQLPSGGVFAPRPSGFPPAWITSKRGEGRGTVTGLTSPNGNIVVEFTNTVKGMGSHSGKIIQQAMLSASRNMEAEARSAAEAQARRQFAEAGRMAT